MFNEGERERIHKNMPTMKGNPDSLQENKEFVYKNFRFSLKKVICYINFTIIHAWKRNLAIFLLEISLIILKKTKKQF